MKTLLNYGGGPTKLVIPMDMSTLMSVLCILHFIVSSSELVISLTCLLPVVACVAELLAFHINNQLLLLVFQGFLEGCRIGEGGL